MKNSIALLITFCSLVLPFSLKSQSFENGDKLLVVNSIILGNNQKMSNGGDNAQFGEGQYWPLNSGSLIKFVRYLGNASEATEAIVEVLRTKNNYEDTIKVGNEYGVRVKQLSENTKYSELDISTGLFSVPFKFGLRSSEVQPGGVVGVFVGGKIPWERYNNTYFTGQISIGGTFVSLNNSPLETDTKISGCVAFSAGLTIINRFNITAIFGEDFYKPESQAKSDPWFSLSFGFRVEKDKSISNKS